MYPSYSPLFTSGLLADHASRSPCPSPSNDDAPSPIYFTLRTRERDALELRSFLYLDLADHNHKQRPPSQRRKRSTLSKSTSWTCTTDAKSTHDLARTDKPILVPSSVPAVPTRRRTSKESLRSIPSPKPAPSATLPGLPIPSNPSLPPSSAPPSPSKKRPAVVSSRLSPSRVRRPASLRSESICSRDRRKSRMDALACLEGRSRAPNRISCSTARRNNFMNLSDDEDDQLTIPKSDATVTPIDDQTAFADVEDELDAIVPSLARKRRLVDPVEPPCPAVSGRKRRSTLESWFPLKSFIDLKDDDLSSWSWRSFIEVGGVA